MSSSIYEIHDRRFRDLIVLSSDLQELYSGCRWAEGPVWFDDSNQLLWSDIPNEKIMRWVPGGGVSVYRENSNFSNGHTRDRQGRLVSCEHGTRRVTRTEIDGTITVLADRFEGKKLNAPNDVVVRSDNTVWFTDPSYGIMSDYEGFRGQQEQPTRNVYRLDLTSGQMTAVVSDFVQPNGLVFSPDETKLYVADSAASHDDDAPRHIRVFDVVDGKSLANGKIFATIDNGVPDGIRVDWEGNVWSSAGDGVHCFAPDGTLIGKIKVPQTVANLTFGGKQKNCLFLAATKSIYCVYLAATGAQKP